jgi:hypothetical protein
VFPQGPVYTGSRTFGDDQTDQFLEEAEKIFTVEDAEDTNIGLEYRYAYSAAQNRYVMSSTQRYAEPVLNPPVFKSLNAIPALSNLTGTINSLANSTRFSGPLGQTRYVLVGQWKAGHLQTEKSSLMTWQEHLRLSDTLPIRRARQTGYWDIQE